LLPLGLALLLSACQFDLNPPDSAICDLRPLQAQETRIDDQQGLFSYCGDSTQVSLQNQGRTLVGQLRMADQNRDLRETALTFRYEINSRIPLQAGTLPLGEGVTVEAQLQLDYEDLFIGPSFTIENIVLKDFAPENELLSLEFTLHYTTTPLTGGTDTAHELFIQAQALQIN
ncbi:MAG: hypothetical protein AAFQ98_22920, partial [Bacteroidota bacterium]